MELEICQKRNTASFYITKLKYAVTEFVSKLTKLANPSFHILHPSLPVRLSMIHNYLDVSMEYVVLQEYNITIMWSQAMGNSTPVCLPFHVA